MAYIMLKWFHYQLGSYFLITAHLYPVLYKDLIEGLQFVDCILLNGIGMQQALHLFLKGYSQFLWSYGWSFFLLYWKKCEVPKLKMQRFGIQCCWHVHNFFNTLGHVNMMTSNFISAFSQVSWNMELLHLGVRAFCYMENLFNPLMVSLFQAD